MKEGFGNYIWKDGKKYVGNYKKNKKDGFGELFDSTGKL